MILFCLLACDTPVAPAGSTSAKSEVWTLRTDARGADVVATLAVRAGEEGRPDATFGVGCAAPPEANATLAFACGVDLVETAVLIAAMHDAPSLDALSLSRRDVITDACAGGTQPPIPSILVRAAAPTPLGDGSMAPRRLLSTSLADLPGRCAENWSNRATGDYLSELVYRSAPSGGGQALTAQVEAGGTSWSASAFWPGSSPPDAAGNLGRLVALGCAYASVDEATSLGRVRLADIVQRLDAEFIVHPPIATIEVGIRRQITPEAAAREFRALEAVSHASNWWRCTPRGE